MFPAHIAENHTPVTVSVKFVFGDQSTNITNTQDNTFKIHQIVLLLYWQRKQIICFSLPLISTLCHCQLLQMQQWRKTIRIVHFIGLLLVTLSYP